MPRLLSRNNRVLGAVGALALVAIAATVLGNRFTDEQERAIDARTARVEAMDVVAGLMSNAVDDQEAALDDYALSRSDASRTRFADAVAEEQAAFDQVGEAVDFAEIKTDLDDLHTQSLDWQATVAAPAIAAVEARDTAALARFATESARDHNGIEGAVERLEADLDQARAELSSQAAGVAVTRAAVTTGGFAFLAVVFGLALILVRRYGHVLERDALQAGVLNRFTELSSFAVEDREIASANLVALGRLVRPDAAVTHVLNRSKDRAVPEASTANAIAEVLPLNALGRCSGVVRGTIYVTDDLSDQLSVHCPIYPATVGTLACLPLNSGEQVGAVHLYWERPNAFPLKLRANVARVAEHAALAIGNRRLLAALHGQANTDPRTGLANSRSFDQALEESLAARSGAEQLSVLMVDIDHFKAFNDRHGHPAGDEALRSFARVLSSCMRPDDVAARYGGEEFAVLLPGVDPSSALAIAERIRSQIESTIISLAPGLTDRITVSIGVASAPEQGLERVTLLRIADEALYRAKAAGRNRVDYLGAPVVAGPTTVTDERPRRKSS